MLRLDPAKKRLLLTTKPILVKEEFTIVKDYDTAVAGTVTEGVVVKISKDGLLIQLWGELRGWAPKSQLSSDPIDNIDKIFWLGQAVKCRILDTDPLRDRISLSLIVDSKLQKKASVDNWSKIHSNSHTGQQGGISTWHNCNVYFNLRSMTNMLM